MNRPQLVAATFTPMNDDGSLNLQRVPQVVDFVLGQGVDGLFIGGSTGEFSSLTVAERQELAAAYLQAIGERVRTFAHVGSNSLPEAQQLAEHAAAQNADAIAYSPPSYFRTCDAQVIADLLREVGAAAPQTPLYYYHIPPLTGAHVRMADLLPLVAEQVPSFAGIKFSSTQLDDLARCVQFENQCFEMLFGADEMLLAGLSVGATGAVGSTYNYLAPHYAKVIDAFVAGDMATAQRAQSDVSKTVHDILDCGGMNAIKAAMAVLGVDCGPPRLPITPLAAPRLQQLKEVLGAESAA